LAELYLKMDESPRAKRLLKFPLASSNDEVKALATELQTTLDEG
jgi:hypothetical protein